MCDFRNIIAVKNRTTGETKSVKFVGGINPGQTPNNGEGIYEEFIKKHLKKA